MYDKSSNSRDVDRVEQTSDKYDESTALVEVTETAHNSRESARNWAWTHSTESYDWMDSHSPFTHDTFH
ncbi:MAG: hypothetical protein WCA85_29720 [Paraburkholderia sp.]|uniref:hypothetical protein n=1 Tax=Paraburkholderia sp. TaxID=1926495 RepID=UPI003C5575F1